MKWPRLRLKTLLILMVPLALVFSLATMARHARSVAQESACHGHFSYLFIALLNYRDRYGRFPSDESTRSTARPRQSWRVHLYKDGYYNDKFNSIYALALPWNHPTNLPFSQQIPNGFFCQNNQSEPGRFTNYVAVIDHGVSSLDRASTILRESPQAADFILLIEYPNSDILWTEPRDLDIKDLDKLAPGADPHGLGVLFADGHFERLSLPELRELLTHPPLTDPSPTAPPAP